MLENKNLKMPHNGHDGRLPFVNVFWHWFETKILNLGIEVLLEKNKIWLDKI